MIPLTAAAASDAVGSDIQNIEGLVNELSTGLHIPELVISLILTVVAFIAAKIISFVIRKGFKRLAGKDNKFTPLMASLMWRICSVLVWIVAILSILAFWGIDLTPVLAGLGVTGIVLGFALQESISSLFSGIMIAINNPFRVGDWVEIGQDGVAGTVKAMDMMCVTLSTADNKKYTVSNKYVWNNTILNYCPIQLNIS